MRQQDILSILITFVVGFVAGGYLYVAHFSKILKFDTAPTQEAASEFTVVGRAYGSCDPLCPSFQVVKDGSYRYFFTKEVGQDRTLKEGTLPIDVQKTIKKELKESALVKQSQPVEPIDCNSRNGGIDVRYEITLEGAVYTLDSCGTAVDGDGELWGSLAKIWNYFETVE
jgi:hypothetical protein